MGKKLTAFGLILDFFGACIMAWYYLFLTNAQAEIDGALIADGGSKQIASLITQAWSVKVGMLLIAVGFFFQFIGLFKK